MKDYEVILESEEVKELKKEWSEIYFKQYGEMPSDKWLNKTITAMLNAYHK
ncbi:MAG: hypothetical protein IIY58_06050 [Aeriscardovia sp.]|nr:hypothetical protein [Aeriscardovia sp.]